MTGDQQQGLKPAQIFVRAPFFGQLDRGAAQVSLVSLQHLLELIEEGESIRGRAGEARQHAPFLQAANLARRVFHHDIAHRHLAIAGHRHVRAATNRQDGGGVHISRYSLCHSTLLGCRRLACGRAPRRSGLAGAGGARPRLRLRCRACRARRGRRSPCRTRPGTVSIRARTGASGRAACSCRPRRAVLRCAVTDDLWLTLLRAANERAAFHAVRFRLAIAEREQTTALGTRHRQRAIPDGVGACGIVGAAVEDLCRLARLALHKLAPAIGADRASFHQERLLEVAVRVAGARDEAPEAARTNEQWLATLRASFIGLLDGFLHLIHLSFGAGQLLFEILVEDLEKRRPLLLAAYHGIELAFHIRREVGVYDVSEVL